MRNCEFLRIGLMPISTNGASATGPAIVIRYSRLVTTLVSPPGKTIRCSGSGIVYAPRRGLLGSLGTIEPSGLLRLITLLSGRNATGEVERISKPRRSL